LDDHTSDAACLLDLDGLEVRRVELFPDGSPQVWLATTDETARACPRCGVFADRVKGVVTTRPRDLPCGSTPLRLVWVKRRWYCRELLCPLGSFTESLSAVPARARLTTRLRERAGTLVVDGVCATVVASGRHLGLAWPTVMDAVREVAAPLIDTAPPPVAVLGIDETRRGRPRWQPGAVTPQSAAPPEPAGSGPVAPVRALAEPVAGEPARARVLADRWHVGFTDLAGGQGMLGQVEGRTTDDVAYWLASQPAAWRDRVRFVAIRRRPRTRTPRDHSQHLVDLHRGVPAHRNHERRQRGQQPGRQLDARNAFGYRNPTNQRPRTRCATTRRTRGCLNPAQLRRATMPRMTISHPT
jgi:transposase